MSKLTQSSWSSYTPVHIIAGVDAIERINELLPASGTILLVTTPGFTKRGLTGRLNKLLGERLYVYDAVTPNPELDDVDDATTRLKDRGITAILALGGGSALDTAKALAVSLPSQVNKPLQKIFREKAKIIWENPLPLIAIPSTAGTGSEVTPFATIWDKTTNSKYSVTGPEIVPKFAVLDPVLTLNLPYEETLYSGLDAISHALESLWNKNKTPVTEAHALHALELTVQSLPQVLENLANMSARAAMQHASLLAGLAISHTRTALAHSISYPITSLFGVPHGLACSFTLPPLIEHYLTTLSDGREKDLIIEIGKLLATLELPKRISSYASQTQIVSNIDLMFHPERAGNFIFDLKNENLVEILNLSTQK